MADRIFQAQWDQRYQSQAVGEAAPAQVLAENRHLLPASGQALDLACGLGANAITLAHHGLDTRAWDISRVAVEKINAYARDHGLPLNAEEHDLDSAALPENSFDVIVVSRFLDRALCPALVQALRPGGLLFYQTFTRTKVQDDGPANRHFLLEDGELLTLFAELRLRVYREEGRLGDHHHGLRNEALLVGER